jgi:hypothetical protein
MGRTTACNVYRPVTYSGHDVSMRARVLSSHHRLLADRLLRDGHDVSVNMIKEAAHLYPDVPAARLRPRAGGRCALRAVMKAALAAPGLPVADHRSSPATSIPELCRAVG